MFNKIWGNNKKMDRDTESREDVSETYYADESHAPEKKEHGAEYNESVSERAGNDNEPANESHISQQNHSDDEVLEATGRIINALRQSISNQKAIHTLLTEQLQQQIEENRRLSEVVQRQHETIASFQNDVFYRSQKDVLLEIIRIADEVETIKEKCGKDNPVYDELCSLSDFIDHGLSFSAVRSYSSKGETVEFNASRQEFDSTPLHTDDVEKDGCLVSLRKGYVWTMPWLVANTDLRIKRFFEENPDARKYEFVIRPEIIGRYRFGTHGQFDNESVAEEEDVVVED